MRKVVLLSRVSRTTRNAVFSAFYSQRDSLINPLLKALERIPTSHTETDQAKGASMWCLKGMKQYPVKRSVESDLLSFELPTSMDINSLIWGMNLHWNLSDHGNSFLATL